MVRNNSFEEIYEKIKEADNIIMSLHSSPDGDSLGSCSAIKYFLEKRLNKKVRLISYDNLSKNLMDFGIKYGVEFGIDITDVNLNEFDLLLVFDSSTPDRIGSHKKGYKLPKEISSISIDHHPFVELFTDLVYCDDSAVSTCSILIDFFNERDIEIDKEIAQRLLLGIVTDSVFFTTNRSEKAIKEISYLIDKGASYLEILNSVQLKKPLNLKRYLGLNIQNLFINKEKRFGYSIIKWEEIKNLDLNVSDIRLGIYSLIDIENLDFVFNLVETPEGVKGSFRSRSNIDISGIVSSLGGGGHKHSAGVYFKDISIEDAEKRVLDAIEDFFNEERIIIKR